MADSRGMRYDATVRFKVARDTAGILERLLQTGILQVLCCTQWLNRTMYAVVEIAGEQFAVTPKQTLTVPLLDKNIGDKVEFTGNTNFKGLPKEFLPRTLLAARVVE